MSKTVEVVSIVSTVNTDKLKGNIPPTFICSRSGYDNFLKNNPNLKNITCLSFERQAYDSLRLDIIFAAFKRMESEQKALGYSNEQCRMDYFTEVITIPE